MGMILFVYRGGVMMVGVMNDPWIGSLMSFLSTKPLPVSVKNPLWSCVGGVKAQFSPIVNPHTCTMCL